jgi:hypothetical protein
MKCRPTAAYDVIVAIGDANRGHLLVDAKVFSVVQSLQLALVMARS